MVRCGLRRAGGRYWYLIMLTCTAGRSLLHVGPAESLCSPNLCSALPLLVDMSFGSATAPRLPLLWPIGGEITTSSTRSSTGKFMGLGAAEGATEAVRMSAPSSGLSSPSESLSDCPSDWSSWSESESASSCASPSATLSRGYAGWSRYNFSLTSRVSSSSSYTFLSCTGASSGSSNSSATPFRNFAGAEL